MLRVALVGIGDAGNHHARALVAAARRDLLRWTAVVGRDPARTAAFLTQVDAPATVVPFCDTSAMLAAHVCDAIILATPDGAHVDGVVTAALHGVAVLVEKPLALDLASAVRAHDAAAAHGVYLAVGYHHRHHAGHRRAFAELATRVGRLRSITVQWAWPDPATHGWRAGARDARWWALAALGTHAIDLAMACAGTELRAVTALSLRTPSGVDRAAEVSLQLGDDVLAHVSVAVTHRARGRITLSGDGGELELRGTLGARGAGEIVHRAGGQLDTPLAFTPIDPYLAQLEAFVAAVPGGFAPDPALLANIDALERAVK